MGILDNFFGEFKSQIKEIPMEFAVDEVIEPVMKEIRLAIEDSK